MEGEHHVGGDEELVDGAVVRGAEEGADEACAAPNGITAEVIGDGFCRGCSGSVPGVGRFDNSAIIVVGASREVENRVHYRLDGIDPIGSG